MWQDAPRSKRYWDCRRSRWPGHASRAGSELERWSGYGQQSGTVMLSDRKLAVKRPRLRQKGPGAGKEVDVPAYAAMQDQPRLSARMLDILMRGVSTRQYRS